MKNQFAKIFDIIKSAFSKKAKTFTIYQKRNSKNGIRTFFDQNPGVNAIISVGLKKSGELRAVFKVVYPKYSTPLILNNVVDADKVSFIYETKDDKFSLNSRGCSYTTPTGDAIISGFGVGTTGLNTNESNHLTVVSSLISDIKMSKNPYIKMNNDKIEVTAEIWCGQGASKFISASGKATIEFQ